MRLCLYLLDPVDGNGRPVPAPMHPNIGSIVHDWHDCSRERLSCRGGREPFQLSKLYYRFEPFRSSSRRMLSIIKIRIHDHAEDFNALPFTGQSVL